MPLPVHLLKEGSEQEERFPAGKLWESGEWTEKGKCQIVK